MTIRILLVLAFTCAGVIQGQAEEGELTAAMVTRCKAATVLVDLGERGSGSGFFIHPCGLFVTNRHVIAEAPSGTPVKLVLQPGEASEKVVEARVVTVSDDDDLALVKTDAPLKIEAIPLQDETGLVELAKTFVFGYPFGKGLATGTGSYPSISINAGRVSALRRQEGKLERIQLDAVTNPGNSGGPILDKDGKAIGVIVSGIPGANVNFAIPAAKVIQMLKQPVLSLRSMEIPYAQRGVQRDFEVEVFPTAPVPSGSQIALKLGEPGPQSRTIPVVSAGGKLWAKAAPVEAKATAARQRLRLEAKYGTLVINTNVDDVSLRVGDRTLQLSEIREMAQKDGTTTVTLMHTAKAGEPEKMVGKVVGLPPLKSLYNEVKLSLEEASSIRVGAYDGGLSGIPYELVLTNQGKPIASSRGELSFSDRPPPLEREDRNWAPFSSRADGVAILPMLDPAKDVKQGSWAWQSGLLETRAEPSAWCELPALPTSDYLMKLRFQPRQAEQGELLLQLPIGGSRAYVMLDRAKGVMRLLMAKPGGESETVPLEPALGIDKISTLWVAVDTKGKHGRIMASTGGKHFLFWIGKVSELGSLPNTPVDPTRLAIGHRNLAMGISLLEIRSREGTFRMARELPDALARVTKPLVGRWSFDSVPSPGKLQSNIGDATATLLGSPEIGVGPGVIGAGALRLRGTKAGLSLNENSATTARTVAFWFKAETAVPPDQRQYLYDEGGALHGACIYLQGGTLIAGNWGGSNKEKTWLKAPGIQPGKWYHVTVTIDGKAADRSQAFVLYLNGSEVAHGPGSVQGKGEGIAFGQVQGKTHFCPDAPFTAGTEQPFVGWLDELEVYDTVLEKLSISILAGGRFSGSVAAAAK